VLARLLAACIDLQPKQRPPLSTLKAALLQQLEHTRRSILRV